MSLVRARDCTSSKGPKGLVDEHDAAPVLDVGSLQSFELLKQDLLLMVTVVLLLVLSNAINDAKITVFGVQNFL